MTSTAAPPRSVYPAAPDSQQDPARRVDLRRLRRPATALALIGSASAAIGQTYGTVVAGDLAEGPTAAMVWLLALCVVGAALADTVGRVIWSTVVDRAEGEIGRASCRE